MTLTMTLIKQLTTMTMTLTMTCMMLLGETCPIHCEKPKSKRCKQRKAAAKCGNQGQNSGGGSKKTCPVKCKLPDSERCKRKNKRAGCNNSGTQTNDPKKPGQPGSETCPVKCERPNSPRCKRKKKNAGCNTNSDPPTNGGPIKPQVPSGDPFPCDNPCKCSGYTITGPLNLPFGHCQTKDPKNKKFFCYVDSNSACSDKAKSGRSVNLFYSHQACDFERACGFIPADCPESNPNCGDAYDSYDYYDTYDLYTDYI